MKAIRIHRHGNVDVLQIDEIEKPIPKADEILIRMSAAALNHLDIWVRKGLPGVPLPIILGSDGVGIIEAIGKNVSGRYNFSIGDEVVIAPLRFCGHCENCKNGKENLCSEFGILGESRDGLMAEYVSIPAQSIVKKPIGINLYEAAAYPLTAITAYHMLVEKAQIKKKDWVLIYGASSGVGIMAIQIAKAMGAKIITTVGTGAKHKMAQKLGADLIINYKKESISRLVRSVTNGEGADIIIEHTGANTWSESLRSLKRGGKVIICGATTGPIVKIDLRALFIKHQQLIGSTMGTLQDLRDVNELIETGRIIPIIDRIFDYSEIKTAHQRLEQGKQFGKIVITFNK
ncbi:MAG: zinc-binding dehydrogenase [Calditrichaceae bacterium]|nr:zinc-binding dehydrogenase [Calditrichaceae bacterium]